MKLLQPLMQVDVPLVPRVASVGSADTFVIKLTDAAKAFFTERRSHMRETFPSGNEQSLVNMLANSCRDFALLPEKRAAAELAVRRLQRAAFFQQLPPLAPLSTLAYAPASGPVPAHMQPPAATAVVAVVTIASEAATEDRPIPPPAAMLV